jgi:hypothetical protein
MTVSARSFNNKGDQTTGMKLQTHTHTHTQTHTPEAMDRGGVALALYKI